MSKRFISWSAVSSRPQAEKISLEEQQRLNDEHVAKHGGSLVAALIVPGESRDIVLFEEAARRIPAYKQLYEAIEARAFDVLIFLNLGRLGRDVALIMAVVRLCQRANIALYATQSPPATLEPSDNYVDNLITALQAVGYQQEISELKRRNEMGMIERINAGEFPTSPPWPWLRRYGERGEEYREIDPTGAKTLQIIQEAYLGGEGTEAIAAMLNAANRPSPLGKQWTGTSVRYIIKNALRYAGIIEYNRRSTTGRPYTVAPSAWPPIWSEATARAILAEKSSRWGNRVRSPHRFSQCVYCTICGEPMAAGTRDYVWQGKRNGTRYERYVCHRGQHEHHQIAAHRITAKVRDVLIGLAAMVDLRDVLPIVPDDSAPMLAELQDQRQRLTELDEELDRIDTMMARGLLDAARYERQVGRVSKERASVLATIRHIEEVTATIEPAEQRLMRLSDFVAQGVAMLTTEDVRLANAFFRRNIKVWVRGGQVERIELV